MKPAKSPRLEVDDPSGRRVVRIDKPVFRIGRKSESDLLSNGPEVSREHAEIIRFGEGLFLLRDRGSRCGTFVNDEQVTEHSLRHRDRIRLGRQGSAEMVFLNDEGTDLRPIGSAAAGDLRPVTTLLDRLRGTNPARVLDEVLVLVMDAALEATGAERGCILLADAKGELEIKIARARGRVTLPAGVFAATRTIAEDVFFTGRDRIVSDPRESDLMEQHPGAVAPGIRHILCAPLRVIPFGELSEGAAGDHPIGVLYLDSRDKGHFVWGAARASLAAVAGEAAAAIESARLYREAAEKAGLDRELRLAAEVQRALLPGPVLSGAHFDVAGHLTACRGIGGDFFDYFSLANGEFAFTLGDVAGKGPLAALLMALAQGALAAQVPAAGAPAELMAHVNRTLIPRTIRSRFVSVFYGALAPDGRFTYCNAGHNPPMLVGRGGIRRLDTGGLILGLFPEATYAQETVRLDAGDTIVAFSDGVTETRNAAGEEFGEERLLSCVREHAGVPPVVLLEKILGAVRAFAAGASRHDDLTALVLRYIRRR